MNKFNNLVANKLSIIMSSMWLFWALAIVLVVIGIVHPMDNPYNMVMYWISAFFQAIALPVLAFVSNLQGDRAEKIAKDTNRAVMQELKLLKEQNEELQKLIKNHSHGHEA